MIQDMPIRTVTKEWLEGLPDEVREHLHVRVGDQVEYLIGPEREVRVRAIDRPSIIGLLHRPDLPPRTLKQLREDMMEHLAEEDERIKRGEE